MRRLKRRSVTFLVTFFSAQPGPARSSLVSSTLLTAAYPAGSGKGVRENSEREHHHGGSSTDFWIGFSSYLKGSGFFFTLQTTSATGKTFITINLHGTYSFTWEERRCQMCSSLSTLLFVVCDQVQRPEEKCRNVLVHGADVRIGKSKLTKGFGSARTRL